MSGHRKGAQATPLRDERVGARSAAATASSDGGRLMDPSPAPRAIPNCTPDTDTPGGYVRRWLPYDSTPTVAEAMSWHMGEDD